MQYHAMYGNSEEFGFDTLEEARKAGKKLSACNVTYNGDDLLKGDLFEALSRPGNAEEVIEFIEGVNEEERLVALRRRQRCGWDADRVLSVPESVNGRIVVDSRNLSPDYPWKVESEEDAIRYYLWMQSDFKDRRGFMTKEDFRRFFDYKGFLEYREIVSFEHAGTFYALLLWPYNYE